MQRKTHRVRDFCRAALLTVIKKKAAVRLATAAALTCLFFVSTTLFSRPSYSAKLLRALEGPIRYDDPELLSYVRNEMLVPPSTKPYNLLGKANPALVKPEASEWFYKNVTENLFGKLKGGTFIEAGALDGETMSNTLLLEMKQGWSGLLVEADPVSYEHLARKNRKAWSLNGCLSPHAYPSQEMISSTSHYTGPSVLAAGFKMRAMHGLLSHLPGSTVSRSWFKKVQCIPLSSILAALNFTHVDLLVLDVEGAEMDILRGFDFEKFKIDVLYMEWKIQSHHDEVAKEVENFGFRLLNRRGEDLVFARKGTIYDPGVSYVIPKLASNLTKQQKDTIKMFAEKGIVLQY